MSKSKDQIGIALLETVLLLAVIAAAVVLGIYIKNHHRSTSANSQTTTKTSDYKSVATDPSKAGTVTSIEAAVNGSASDESQTEQQLESSQAATTNTDSSDGNNVGDTVNENLINF